MKLVIPQSDLRYLAQLTGKTEEQILKEIGEVTTDEIVIREHRNRQITDRINKRLRGVHVAPAWIEGLRRH